MADGKVEIEKDGPDEIVRVDGTIIGRLTGEGSNRQMQWRAGETLDREKVLAFDKGFGASDRSADAARAELKKAGLA